MGTAVLFCGDPGDGAEHTSKSSTQIGESWGMDSPAGVSLVEDTPGRLPLLALEADLLVGRVGSSPPLCSCRDMGMGSWQSGYLCFLKQYKSRGTGRALTMSVGLPPSAQSKQ